MDQTSSNSDAPLEVSHAHDNDFGAQRAAPITWHPAGKRLHPDNDHIPSFRTCSWCGSMHPQDLLAALRDGATMHLADMKYGWPHKFYVDGIKNTNAGNMVRMGSTSIDGPEPSNEERERMQAWATKAGAELRVVKESYNRANGQPAYSLAVFEPAGATTHGKFYSVHMMDASDELLAELAPLIAAKTRILFSRDANGTKYGPAPRGDGD